MTGTMEDIDRQKSAARMGTGPGAGMVLASIAGLWLCYFALTTIRAEMLDIGLESELLWRRALVTLAGMAVTLVMWLILRLFDSRALWIKITAALLLAAPGAVALAHANRAVFADIEAQVMEEMGARQGLRVRRDESGDLLVDVPVSQLPPAPIAPPAPPEPAGADGDAMAPEAPAAPVSGGGTITIDRQSVDDSRAQQLTEIALGRYFLLLAWCALYLALVAGEQARAAERREGEFRRAAKAAELRSLRYQVNPHFLFNTLNSLSALVLTGRTEQAEAMIQTISTFYRRSLADDPTADVTLAEEFELQRLYLEVEAVRFPERLRAEFDLPPELAHARVPGMILQPLIENSVRHAVAPSTGRVRVLIMAREEFGRLVLSVSDDGRAGAGAGGGEPVRPGHGIGLANVRDRLEARFGDTASLTCGDTGQGYATLIRLPILPGKDGGPLGDDVP